MSHPIRAARGTLDTSNATKRGAKRLTERAQRLTRFETLEDRRMMAGDLVDVSSWGVLLQLGGTSGNDWVEVTPGSRDQVIVKQRDWQGQVVHISVEPRPEQIFFNGKAGHDFFFNNTDIPSIAWGGEGDDTLWGGSSQDIMDGGLGNDKIDGAAGNDRLWGGPGQDEIFGGQGDDVIYTHGTPVNDPNAYGYYPPAHGYLRPADSFYKDEADGGSGNDIIHGSDDHEILRGGDGADQLFGFEGADQLYGDDGWDRLWGGAGNDELHGGADGDWLYGNAGYDKLYGDAGADILDGGDQADWLFGGLGQDFLIGGNGDDFLNGGEQGSYDADGSADFLIGGPGSDWFVLPVVTADKPHTVVEGRLVEDYSDYNAREDHAEFRSLEWTLQQKFEGPGTSSSLLDTDLYGDRITRK